MPIAICSLRFRGLLLLAIACCLSFCAVVVLGGSQSSGNSGQTNQQQPSLLGQSKADAEKNSAGCLSCHTFADDSDTRTTPGDYRTMHATGSFYLGCTDCHGGDPVPAITPGIEPHTKEYDDMEEKAHKVVPRSELHTPSHSVRAYTQWLQKNKEYIRFVNPGDLRVLEETCGRAGCHVEETQRVRTSMMTTGAMLWAAALYNNGSFPYKDAHFGQSYTPDGQPQELFTWPPARDEKEEEVRKNKGILPFLLPLERWEVSQPGNVLRVFERGGEPRGEIGNPRSEELPGKPDDKLSDRGFGTLLRTDPVFLGLQKTRLLDPMLSFPGTNDHPGDYRGSGCTACHVIYANDNDREHSGPYYEFGHLGRSFQSDPRIPKDKSGHPIHHVLTKQIPSSQCMVCHVHPGTNMVASFYGDTWWDNEVDGEQMYPKDKNGNLIQRNPSQEEYRISHMKNPDGSAARGRWSEDNFLNNTGSDQFNQSLKHTRFDDFHGHGWIFRKVYKQDRKGNLLDASGEIIPFTEEDRFQKAVHLEDIHLAKGMHCVDCHFNQDVHGNGNLYGETRNAIEITCIDCHGTVQNYANLITSGPAAPNGGTKLQGSRTPWKELRFFWKDERLFQRSSVELGKEWEVVQVKDVVTPDRPHYNRNGQAAMLLGTNGMVLDPRSNPANSDLAHPNNDMTCFSCHSSWTTTCFGCHLPMTANQRMPMLQNEGTMTRNWTEYDFQVLRNDMYMLGRDGTVTGNKIAPIRSACAVVVSSQNQNRDWIYYGQQTVSAGGLSGTAFSPYMPHTVSAKETRKCTDCHISSANDNNAWMAQLLLQGTNFLNYLGRFAYVANGSKGFSAIAFAERQEPEAVIGSDLHKIAYPNNHRKHTDSGFELKEAYTHPGKAVLDVQLRGEYLYAAMGKGGLRVYDVANIENKDFSQRMITAPVSPRGQEFFVATKYAMAVAAPSTTAIDPTRKQFPENEEKRPELMYGFLYVADRDEGLVVVGDASTHSKTPGVSTLLDGEPRNNFLKRLPGFNPRHQLDGARHITIAGFYAYILCNAGLVVVDIRDPLHLSENNIKQIIGLPALKHPNGIVIQFRYAFVVDGDEKQPKALKVLDITHVDEGRITLAAKLDLPDLPDARDITVSRTYAYIAAEKHGIGIVEVEKPEQPRFVRAFTGDEGDECNEEGKKPKKEKKGKKVKLEDTYAIQIGMVSSSQFALVADGIGGFKVVQMFSPQMQDGFYGFSPTPCPKIVAVYHTHGKALAVSRGVDRDRAVDESGNQLSVFGRRGSRPFNRDEMRKLYLCSHGMANQNLCREGEVYTVTDDDPQDPVRGKPQQAAER